MTAIVAEIKQRNWHRYDSDKFYLIAVSTESGSDLKRVIRHELSHALFYLNESYRKEMLDLVKKIPKSKRIRLCDVLGNLNYTKSVHSDEIVAYMATGLIDEMKFMKTSTDLLKSFRRVFRDYARQS